jgi:hypothetical protein
VYISHSITRIDQKSRKKAKNIVISINSYPSSLSFVVFVSFSILKCTQWPFQKCPTRRVCISHSIARIDEKSRKKAKKIFTSINSAYDEKSKKKHIKFFNAYASHTPCTTHLTSIHQLFHIQYFLHNQKFFTQLYVERLAVQCITSEGAFLTILQTSLLKHANPYLVCIDSYSTCMCDTKRVG